MTGSTWASSDLILSVVIVNYNTTDLVLDCLASMYTSVRPSFPFEVLVVDNGSRIDDVYRITDRFPNTLVLRMGKNQGFSRANNIAVSRTSANYVLFLNPDTIVHAGTLDEMVAFMEQNPRAGASTCYVALPDGSLDDAAHRGFPTPWNSLCFFLGLTRLAPRSRFFAGYSQGWSLTDPTHSIAALAGAFMLVRRSAGDILGWWDEDFFFYGEDLDFCFRLKAAGWEIFFVPQVAITHLKGMSSGIKRVSRDSAQADTATRFAATHARFSAMKIFYHKHYDQAYPRPITWAVMCGISIKEWLSLRALAQSTRVNS